MRNALFAMVMGLVASGLVGPGAGSAFADGGDVLPSRAKPKGYSLREMAGITAFYNSTFIFFEHSSNSPPNPPPNVPFHILVTDTTVRPGTSFYVPIFYQDDAGGAGPGFPADVSDQAADAAFVETALFEGYGITDLFLRVDGQITTLDGSYVTGAISEIPLIDGAPPLGSRYICSAAFMTPLTPGVHTVEIGGFIAGKPVVFRTYSVTVRRSEEEDE